MASVLSALCGVIAGFLSGFLGIGGNVALIPLLGLTLGLTQHQAQGLTLAALLPPVGLPAVWQYQRAGVPILWKVVLVGVLGFLVGVPMGSLLANHLPAVVLQLLFAMMLAGTAVRTWRSREQLADESFIEHVPRGFFAPTLAGGVLSGFASGLLGIGGAIVFIPFMRRALRLGQKQAQALSLALLLFPVALPGVLVYAQAQGGLPWRESLPIALGFGLGAFLGATLTRRLSPRRLTRAFAVLLLGASVLMVLSALRNTRY